MVPTCTPLAHLPVFKIVVLAPAICTTRTQLHAQLHIVIAIIYTLSNRLCSTGGYLPGAKPPFFSGVKRQPHADGEQLPGAAEAEQVGGGGGGALLVTC